MDRGRIASSDPPRSTPTASIHVDAADLDLPRLGLLGLGEDQGQDAVLELRLGLVGIDGRGQRERPLERAEPALAQVPPLALLLLLGLGLALDGQGIAVDGDLHVLGLDARQRGLDHEFVLILRDVEREQAGAPAGPGRSTAG